MELVALLRILWRYRIATLAGAGIAVALGVMALRSGSTSSVGVASLRVLLDTPKSQTVDVDPKNAWTLEWRAALLADLAPGGTVRGRVLRELHIPAGQLNVTTPDFAAPPVPFPLPVHAIKAATGGPEPYQLVVSYASYLPIMGLDASAPTKAEAARVANAAADALRAEAATDRAPDSRFVVDDMGPVQAKQIVNHPRKIIAPLVTMVVFLMWCSALTVFAAVARRRRHRRAHGVVPALG
jgi:hypothetical protein